MDQFNILHATINDTFLNIKSKRLRPLVCYILHTSMQYCIKTISVAICLRHSDIMTGLLYVLS